MTTMLDSKFIKMLYEWYKSYYPYKKPLAKAIRSNLTKKEFDLLIEYNVLFKSLYFSPILKNIGVKFNDLNLSNIIKSDKPDFKLSHNGNIIGIEIKIIRLRGNNANETIEEIDDEKFVENFLQRMQKDEKNRIINKILFNNINKASGYNLNFFDPNRQNVLSSIQKTNEAIARTNKIKVDKFQNMFLVIHYLGKIDIFNLLNDKQFDKYNYEYKSAEQALMILKIK